jgi:hypothetical protein
MKQPPRGRASDHDADDDALLEMLGLDPASPGATAAGCPSFEQIQAAQADALPDDEGRTVLGHLAACEACRALGAAAREWEGPELAPEARERIRPRVAAPPAVRRVPSWLLPLAAAVALAITAPFLLRDRVQPSLPDPGRSPAPAAFVLPLGKLERRSPPSLQVRGDDPFDAALADALAPYEANDLGEAAVRLTGLARAHPDAASPRLYLGVAELLQGRPEAARAALLEARPLARAFWTPHVLWYLAIADERVGDREAAARLLAALCGQPGEYRDRACAALAGPPFAPAASR